MSDTGYELTVGSKYLIRLPDEDDTIGLFMGYTMIGTESAVVVKMDGDRIRLIPVTGLTFLDLLESASQEPEHRSQPEHLYG